MLPGNDLELGAFCLSTGKLPGKWILLWNVHVYISWLGYKVLLREDSFNKYLEY